MLNKINQLRITNYALRIPHYLCIFLLLTSCAPLKSPHYEVRQDLGVYFSNADAVIGSIRDAMRERAYQVTIHYKSHSDNMEELSAIVRELVDYALEPTDDPTEGDYIRYQYGGYELHYSYQREGELYAYTVTIEPQYYTTAEQEQEVTARVEEILDELDVKRSWDDLAKVEAVCNYITGHVRYDEVHAKHPNYPMKATAYAALIQGTAVCQGYAVTVYRLLRELGIPTRVETGEVERGGKQVPHAWNSVQIDGEVVELDTTKKLD